MHILFIGSDRTFLDIALRSQKITTWTITMLGNELPYPKATKALDGIPTMDLSPFDAIILTGAHLSTYHGSVGLAEKIVARKFTGKFLVFAGADKPDAPNETRRNMRKVGVQDHQFIPSLDDAIRELKR